MAQKKPYDWETHRHNWARSQISSNGIVVDINKIKEKAKVHGVCLTCGNLFRMTDNGNKKFCSKECKGKYYTRFSSRKLRAIEITYEVIPDKWSRLFDVCEIARTAIWQEQGREMLASSVRKYIDKLIEAGRVERRSPYKGKTEIRRTKGSTA